MCLFDETARRLGAIPGVTVHRGAPLSRYTRFGVGGPAAIVAESPSEEAFLAALRVIRELGLRHVVIGGGTNLIAADTGYEGAVLRFTGSRLAAGGPAVSAEAGAELQALVDFTIGRGLGGLETLTGIPGSVGAAVYGNAGAYGHSVSEVVSQVRFFDGTTARSIPNSACEFQYRESIFKRRKTWIIFSAELALNSADPKALRRTADEIRQVRDRRYPPEMRCAGSIFKNLTLAGLSPEVARQVPGEVVREGKVPAGFFLEQVGAKGMSRGDMKVAAYHGNLIYNDGQGSAADLCALIAELKRRVRDRFGLALEEEVQYIGFPQP